MIFENRKDNLINLKHNKDIQNVLATVKEEMVS